MSTQHSTESASAPSSFATLGLPPTLLRALSELGYESPSPIQQATIPVLLTGQDLVGQAQTGTGKTAAFALPILARLDLSRRGPQALVLTPTRELTIQVAEAFQRYAAQVPDFHVLPIYGGQAYGPQLAALRRGAHVVVGTPGRVIDHLQRGSLSLDGLTTLVLDEGDEMLRMGFIDDVEQVLKLAPPSRQVAIFSATMPPPIRRIAQTYLRDPQEITIRNRTTTVANTRQRYWAVGGGMQKVDGLTRLLEVEPFDAMIVFVRTKVATEELAQHLQTQGFSAAALNGDMLQEHRERTIDGLKRRRLNILVATDVAARGLDVERISHVVNFDIPYDTEAYVHRIGRTGRAGRSGEAILFVTSREQRLLRVIERATGQRIEPLTMPSLADVQRHRVVKFKDQITTALASPQLHSYRDIVASYAEEHDVPAVDIAAALVHIAQGDKQLAGGSSDGASSSRPAPRAAKPPRDTATAVRAPVERPDEPQASERPAPVRSAHEAPVHRPPPQSSPTEQTAPRRAKRIASGDLRPQSQPPADADIELERYRLAVGNRHNVQIGHIVGAIANEADLDGRYIRNIDVHDEYTLVDLPVGMPRALLKHLKKVRVAGQPIRIQLEADPANAEESQGKQQSPSANDSVGKPPRGPDTRPDAERKSPRYSEFRIDASRQPPRRTESRSDSDRKVPQPVAPRVGAERMTLSIPAGSAGKKETPRKPSRKTKPGSDAPRSAKPVVGAKRKAPRKPMTGSRKPGVRDR